jgi:chaperonin cofactor prefoldin
MTVQYNLKNPEGLKKGDILIFDGKKFDVITKEQIVKDLHKEFEALKQEVEMLRNQTNQIKVQVNQRQKRFLGAFVKKVK